MSPAKSPNTSSFLLSKRRLLFVPKCKCKIGVFTGYIFFYNLFMYRAAEKDIAFKSVRHYRIPAILGFATQPAPTLSMTAIILAVYFFNLRLIPYVPTMPFQKTILCYNSIGSRRRLTILVLAEVQLWK